MRTPREVIFKALDNSMGHAKDAVYRAEQQLRRMPFDHDTREALERYKVWETEVQIAMNWLEQLPIS